VPKSPLALQLDAIQRPMTMLLKSQEFRVNGRTFNRRTTDGFTQRCGNFPFSVMPVP
jgi:hypothetical protein